MIEQRAFHFFDTKTTPNLDGTNVVTGIIDSTTFAISGIEIYND
jgi:hypothetical protein